jgi:hypothetical protein
MLMIKDVEVLYRGKGLWRGEFGHVEEDSSSASRDDGVWFGIGEEFVFRDWTLRNESTFVALKSNSRIVKALLSIVSEFVLSTTNV